ncbi:MAG: DUF1308 domain-containing protein [Hydrococcus sp. Prado102]|nr:DUF1308 domain-containing protein [Hydrococcus sp. Prado102]
MSVRNPGNCDIVGRPDGNCIVTMTADAKAVRAASAQGVNFNVCLHLPYPLTGC